MPAHGDPHPRQIRHGRTDEARRADGLSAAVAQAKGMHVRHAAVVCFTEEDSVEIRQFNFNERVSPYFLLTRASEKSP